MTIKTRKPTKLELLPKAVRRSPVHALGTISYPVVELELERRAMRGLAPGLVTQLRYVLCRELGCCTAKPTRDVVGDRRDLRVGIGAAECRHRQAGLARSVACRK